MDKIRLRLNEIRFHNNIMNVLRNGDVTSLQKQLNSIIQLINHPAPIAISTAWMETVSMKLKPNRDEIIILLHLNGDSKNSIRLNLNCSPNTVYRVIRNYNTDPYPIEPKLDISTSEYVTMFIEELDNYLNNWKGELI